MAYIYVVHSHIHGEVQLFGSISVSEELPGILLLSAGLTQRQRDQCHLLRLPCTIKEQKYVDSGGDTRFGITELEAGL